MAIINQLECTLFRGGNTGWGKCVYEPAARKFNILIPKGTTISASDFATIETYLQGKLTADAPASRFHAFGPVEEHEDQSEDREQVTFQSGRKVTTKDPTEQVVYVVYDGGLCTQKSILDFEHAHLAYDVLHVDKNNFLQFDVTKISGVTYGKGFDMGEFYPFPMKPVTFNEVAKYRYSISHENAKAMQKTMGIVPLGFNFDLTRQNYMMQNAYLTDVTPNGASAGVFHVQVMGGCGNDNLAVLYPTLMANVARFSAKNKTTGGVITISSCALNTDGTAFVLTLNTADSDYPSTGNTIGINLADPSVLGAAGVKWYEDYIPANQTYALEVAAT